MLMLSTTCSAASARPQQGRFEEIAACVTDDFEWRLNAGGSPSGTVLKARRPARYFADRSKAHREGRYSEARIHRAGDKLSGPSGSPLDRAASRSTATASTSRIEDGKIALKDSYLKVD